MAVAPVLNVIGMDVKYHTRIGTLTAIRNINFSINPGEIMGIVGESGCGKSTVASALMRLLPLNGEISKGQVILNGRDLCGLNDEQMRLVRGREMSMIFQDAMTSLNPVYNIEEQMTDVILEHSAEGIKNKKDAHDFAVNMLRRVGIPDASVRIKQYPHQFSGGMRQRIMIAMALLSNPALLIADEPTSALDVTLEAQINDLILNLRDERKTAMLYITHNLGVIAQLCDNVLVLYAGSIAESGSVHQVFYNPLHPYTRALLNSHPSRNTTLERLTTIPGRVPNLKDLPVGCKFVGSCGNVQAVCHEREPEMRSYDGQRVACHMYGDSALVPVDDADSSEKAPQGGLIYKVTIPRPEAEESLIQTANLSTYFSGSHNIFGKLGKSEAGLVRAVDGVSIEVHRGETLALVGESGSGKTTLGRTILRLEDPAKGDITIEGTNITGMALKNIRPMRARMQMIFQDPVSSLSPRKTVAKLLLEPFKIHGIKIEDKTAKVREMLELVGLSSEQADKYPHQLSGGQARRVGIARALALEPDVLIADEPTSGLDVSVAAEVLNLLKDLREKMNLTYIIITHNLNVTGYVADRIAVMYLGKIVEMGNSRELFANPRHPYTEALLSAVAIPDPEVARRRKRIILEGEIPSAINPPSGCHFHPRCRYRQELCTTDAPVLRPLPGMSPAAATATAVATAAADTDVTVTTGENIAVTTVAKTAVETAAETSACMAACHYPRPQLN